jgi:serine/threonine protein kinase
MEYCGGGDLSHLIRECERSSRQISEETIWDYFYQIALALKHCHSGGGSGTGEEEEPTAAADRRPPSRGAPVGRRESGKERERVLHRDLKPDNGTSALSL